MLNYEKLMEDWDISLEKDPNHVLDPAFVSKATTLQEKIKNNQLTDEEIAKEDAELVEMFNALEKETVDSDELKDANHQRDIANARAEIAEADTIDLLTSLKKKFKNLPEVQDVIEKKIKKFQDAENSKKQKEEQEAKDKLFGIAKKEIADCDYDNLQAIGEKYKNYPELVEIISKRITDEKPLKDQKELAGKLRAKKQWTYAELQALGVKPTGEDMTVAGVRLEKEWMFNIYSVLR